MDKKILAISVAVLMVFTFTGISLAGEATQVFVELTKNTTYPYDPAPIRGRVLILDAEGLLATTFAGGNVNTCKLLINSAIFKAECLISTQQIEVPSQELVFPLDGSDAQISLSSAEQEFALSYDYITDIGDDTLVVTLQRSPTQFITNQTGGKPPIIIDVTAPPANAYVVRTGGVPDEQLPLVLETVPPIRNNNGARLRAGQTYNVDVFAVFALDSDGPGGAPAELIFTNNVPENAVETIYGTLVDGHLKAVGKVEKVDATKITSDVSAALGIPYNANLFDLPIAQQLAVMQYNFQNGITSTIALAFPTTRTIGDLNGDVNVDGRLTLTAGHPSSFNVAPPNLLSDTVNYRPAKVSKINLIGLPVTDINDNLVTLGSNLSVKDATTFIPDIKATVTDFKVNTRGNPATGIVYAALIGYDVYGNLAPFYQDQTNYAGSIVAFQLQGAGVVIPYQGYGTTTGAIITTTNALQAFLPIVITGNYPGLYVTKPASPASPLDPLSLSNIDQASEARNFSLGNYVTGVVIPGINVQAGGNYSVKITVNGSAQENAFTMKAFKASGGAVKVNVAGSDAPSDSVVIPTTQYFNAEQDVSFYTTAQNVPLRLVFTGLSNKTTFIGNTAGATIEPADSSVYPPSSVSVGLVDINIYMDIAERHDEASAHSVISIRDAFGNIYAGTYNGSPVYTMDAYPTVQVFKSDGTTPFPGATGQIYNDELIVSFALSDISATNTQAIVKISAGTASNQITLNLFALNQTTLTPLYQYVKGTTTPVQLNFADQNGNLVPPVVLASGAAGSFEIGLQVIDGYIAGTGIGETTILSTNTPYRIFRAQPASGKDGMIIRANGVAAQAGITELVLGIDPDTDNDGITDSQDNCRTKPNGYDLGSCSPWSGSPGVQCESDNDCTATCTGIRACNKNQEDTDNDGVGDVCDNCPNNCNSLQKDADSDGIGDVCDPTPECGGCGQPQCEQQC